MKVLYIVFAALVLSALTGHLHAQELTVVGRETDAITAVRQQVLKAAQLRKQKGDEAVHSLVCDLDGELTVAHHAQMHEHIKNEGHIVLKNASSDAVARVLGIGIDAPTLAIRSEKGGRHLHILVADHRHVPIDMKRFGLPEEVARGAKAAKDAKDAVAPNLAESTDIAPATPTWAPNFLADFLAIAKSAEPAADARPAKVSAECDGEQPVLVSQNSEQSITYSLYFPESKWGLDNPKLLKMWARYDLNLYATSAPNRAKFLQVIAQEVGFNAVRSFKSKERQGWITCAAEVSIQASPELATRRLAYAPKGDNNGESVTYSSGYSFGASVGGSGDSPTTGLSFSRSESTAGTTSYKEFSVVDSASSTRNTWQWRYTDAYSNKPNLLVPGYPEFKPGVPAVLSYSTLSPKFEVLYRLPENDTGKYTMGIAQSGAWGVLNAYTEGVNTMVSLTVPQYGNARTIFTIDFSQVKLAQ